MHRETSSYLSWLLKSNFFFLLPQPKEKALPSQRNKQENSFKAKMQSLGWNTETSVGLGRHFIWMTWHHCLMWMRHPETPGLLRRPWRSPWSLSPDLPEGITSVHKTCRLDFLFLLFCFFFLSLLLLILCIEFNVNNFLKCISLLKETTSACKLDRCLCRKILVFVWIMREERLEIVTSQSMMFVTRLYPHENKDFLLSPFCI